MLIKILKALEMALKNILLSLLQKYTIFIHFRYSLFCDFLKDN